MLKRLLAIVTLLLVPSAWLIADVQVNVALNADGTSAAANIQEPSDMATDGGASADEATSASSVPQMPSQEQQDYTLGVSDYYRVPPQQAWDYQARGISAEELTVVFHLAAAARVAPEAVIELREQGLTWREVAMQLGLTPAVFYWNDVFSVNLGGPFANLYLGFHSRPRGLWRWDNMAMGDIDIVNAVNLRFSSAYWHRPVVEFAQGRREGRPFFHIGYGYNQRFGAPYQAHHPGQTWGHGFQQHYRAQVAAGHMQRHIAADHRPHGQAVARQAPKQDRHGNANRAQQVRHPANRPAKVQRQAKERPQQREKEQNNNRDKDKDKDKDQKDHH